MTNCNICKLKINKKEDDYSEIIDFKEGKEKRRECYHHYCYSDWIRGKKEDVEKARRMMNGLGPLMQKLGMSSGT